MRSPTLGCSLRKPLIIVFRVARVEMPSIDSWATGVPVRKCEVRDHPDCHISTENEQP